MDVKNTDKYFPRACSRKREKQMLCEGHKKVFICNCETLNRPLCKRNQVVFAIFNALGFSLESKYQALF